MCVYLSHDYDHMLLPIVMMTFGINIFVSKVEQRVCKEFLTLTSSFKLAAVLWAFFAVTSVERGIMFIEVLVKIVKFKLFRMAK